MAEGKLSLGTADGRDDDPDRESDSPSELESERLTLTAQSVPVLGDGNLPAAARTAVTSSSSDSEEQPGSVGAARGDGTPESLGA